MQKTNNHRYRLLTGGTVTLLLLLLQWWQPSWLSRLDGIAYDFKLTHFSPPRPQDTANIQIVDIDEKSLTAIGRWPWPRRQLARLVRELTAQGAIVIAFDMLFSEPQQNPVLRVQQALAQQQRSVDLSSISAELDDDAQFASALSGNETILGTLFLQQAQAKGSIEAPNLQQNLPSAQHALLHFQGYNASIRQLNQAAQGQGFINAVIDQDGFIRRTALLCEYNGKLYPSLALEAFRIYSLAETITPLWHIAGHSALISGLNIGAEPILTDERGQMLVPFKGPAHSFRYSSASDVIKQNISDKRFENAVVFVGTSAVGLADLRTTPYSLVYPGIELHATVFAALMHTDAQPYQPDWWLGANSLLLIILGIVLTWLLPRLAPTAMFITTVVIVGLVWAANLYLWHQQYLHLPIVAVLLLLLCLAIFAIGSGFFQENQQRRRVKAIFDQYVPPAHIERLLDESEFSGMRGERKRLSVLFSDIRNFTQISENLPAYQLKQLLNDYFSPITEIIFQHQGTIDKYVGDMVMAFWGAPLPDKQHAEHAILAALAMQRCTRALSLQFEARQLPAIAVGIGINTGAMNVGDMGSTFRRAYTVIGDAVNLASRLESLTKYYGVPILLSEHTKKAAPGFRYQVIDKVRVKGKERAIVIYCPIDNDAGDDAWQQAERFNAFFAQYQRRNFGTAEQLLSEYQQHGGNEVLISRYLLRLQEFNENPTDESWDGTYTHKDK